MRYVAAGVVALAFLVTRAGAEPIAIDQSAWLNYAVIAHTDKQSSDIRLRQRGEINAIASVQLYGKQDAWLSTTQKGRLNNVSVYLSGWNTISQVEQSGPDGGGRKDLPTRYIGRETDDGYLSYFMTGGFSLVTLTDQNHTWVSRFGRSR